MLTELNKGIIRQGAVVNIAAAATATTLYQVSNNANQIGTKSFKLKKLMVRSNGSGDVWLSIGTGLGGAFLASYPAIRVLNNIDNEWQEVEIPNIEFFADMTGSIPVLPAGSLDIQAEVEEIG